MTARTRRSELRRRAEARVGKSEAGEPAPAAEDAARLLHELRVHQVELEMQNEELRTSRLEIEKLLARYAELFDYAPVGFFQLSDRGAILACNFAGARLLGHERANLIGRPLAGLVSHRDRPAFDEFLAAVLTQPEDAAASLTREVVFLGAAGDLHARLTGSVLDRAPAPTALLALEDVTARRRAEEVLRDESRRKDEFLAALSHELRNPLAPIRNALSLLHLLPSGSDKSAAAWAVLDRQTEHLTHIVDDLLDVTRVARGKVHLQRLPLDLGDLVRRTVEDHRAGFEGRGVRLEAAVDGVACWVDGDASRLVQVLGNLLGNALKFTDAGGRVTVSLAREGGAAVLRVRDDGIGIEAPLLKRMFEPFAQGPQALDRSRGGLGLGLPTVKGLVELHGGTIVAGSAGPGRGAEFTIRLPTVRPPLRTPATAAPPPAVAQRVLIVEDNSDAALTLKDLLELSGHEVRVAADGPAGLSAAREFRPEVVLCDLGLPGMSGYEFARALRADGLERRPWLVALSGYGQPEDVHRSGASGFDRHVTKPASLATLEECFAQAAAHAR